MVWAIYITAIRFLSELNPDLKRPVAKNASSERDLMTTVSEASLGKTSHIPPPSRSQTPYGFPLDSSSFLVHLLYKSKPGRPVEVDSTKLPFVNLTSFSPWCNCYHSALI